MSPGIIVTVCERCPEATAHRNTWNFANASKMVMHQIRAISGKTGCVSWLLTLWTQVGWKFMRETCTAKLSGGLWFSIITLWFSIITLWFPIITGSFRGLYEPGNHCNRMGKMPRGNCTQKHLKYCTGLWRCNTLELNSMSRVLSYGDVMFRHAPTRRYRSWHIFYWFIRNADGCCTVSLRRHAFLSHLQCSSKLWVCSCFRCLCAATIHAECNSMRTVLLC